MQDRAERLKEGSAYERASKSILGPALTPNTSGICIQSKYSAVKILFIVIYTFIIVILIL